jgi:PAS domain S-box-containing protein
LSDLFRNSKELNNILNENTSDVFWVLDEDFKTVFITPSVEKVFGYTVEEAMELPYKDFFTPRSWEITKEVIKIRKELNTKGIIDKELKKWDIGLLHKDGHVLKTEVSTTPVYDGDIYKGVVCLVHDAQASEIFLKDLERNERRIHLLTERYLNSSTDPMKNIAELTNLAGEIFQPTCALYNRLDEGLLCSWGQWNTPPDYEPVDEPEGHICYDVITRSGEEPYVIHDLQNSEYFDSDPNVKKYNLETYIGKGAKLGNDYIGSLCIVFQERYVPTREDIDFLSIIASAIGQEEARLKVLNDLEASKEKYFDFMERLTESCFVVDDSLNVTYANRATSTITTMSREDFIGRDLKDLIPGIVDSSFGKAIQKTLETGEDMEVLDQLKSYTGNEFVFRMSVSKVKEGALIIAKDKTKEIEDKEKLEDKDEMLHIINKIMRHDIRNRLAVAYGLLGLARESERDLEFLLETAYNEVHRAIDITKRMGELEAITMTGQEMEMISIPDIVGRIAKQFIIPIKMDGECRVKADDALYSVFENLFHNALVHGHADNIIVRTSTDNDTCTIEIIDDGEGIPEKFIDEIFEEGISLGESRGSGLGLYIVRKNIERYQGTIDVMNNEEKGARFIIRLPLWDCE